MEEQYISLIVSMLHGLKSSSPRTIKRIYLFVQRLYKQSNI